MEIKRLIRLLPGYINWSISSLKMLPSFIIIGAQRCGTTSLFNYLIQHPSIKKPFYKEVHFFDNYYGAYNLGFGWYRGHFPINTFGFLKTDTQNQRVITGEATPYYMFHPSCPKRIKEALPDVKLIALLRNPAERAYSHYQHSVREGYETISFKEALEKEKVRLKGEREKILSDPNYYSFNHNRYSYLSRGIYINQLQNWRKYFPKEQMLILRSEDLFYDLSSIYNILLEFLGLPEFTIKRQINYNVGHYSPMAPSLRDRLVEYFKPHNKKLYEYLARDLEWE
jgi:Sulfotransferase domain